MKSVQTIIRTGKTMGRDTRSERAIFCKFQKSYDQFPVGEIMHVDKPDFIICGERKIGVEITQMFQDQHYQSGSLLKSAEVYKVKVLECLTEFLRNQKTPYCSIIPQESPADFNFFNRLYHMLQSEIAFITAVTRA